MGGGGYPSSPPLCRDRDKPSPIVVDCEILWDSLSSGRYAFQAHIHPMFEGLFPTTDAGRSFLHQIYQIRKGSFFFLWDGVTASPWFGYWRPNHVAARILTTLAGNAAQSGIQHSTH